MHVAEIRRVRSRPVSKNPGSLNSGVGSSSDSHRRPRLRCNADLGSNNKCLFLLLQQLSIKYGLKQLVLLLEDGELMLVDCQLLTGG